MKRLRKILDANYRKLWILPRTNATFRYAVYLIRHKWYSFSPTVFEQAKGRLETLEPLHLLQEAKELLKSQLLGDDVTNLAQEFGFEDFWFPSLAGYLMTGRILPPVIKRSKVVPPPTVVRQEKIFYFKIISSMQKEQLQKKGVKPSEPKKKAIVPKEGDKDDTPISDRKFDLHGQVLIHQYADISDEVYGHLDLDDEHLSEKERKRINLVKTDKKRFRQRLTGITPHQQRRLQKLFS